MTLPLEAEAVVAPPLSPPSSISAASDDDEPWLDWIRISLLERMRKASCSSQDFSSSLF